MIPRLVRGRPLREKLALVIALASVFGLVLAGAAVVAYDVTTFRPRVRRDAETQAVLMRTVTAPALVFNDPQAATENLATLRTRPEIAAATVYDRDGRVFATYLRTGATPLRRPARFAPSGRIADGHIDLLGPIIVDKDVIGWLALRRDMVPLGPRLMQYALSALVVILALLAAGLLLLRVLAQTVTGPLSELADAAQSVERTGDVGVRVPTREPDEIGTLSNAFNRMLDRLEAQQEILQTSEARLRLALEAATMEPWAVEATADGLAALERQVHPDDRLRVRSELSRALEQGTLDVEFRAGGDGDERWTALRGHVQRDAEGRVARLFGVAQDVTRRRRLELQLIQSQKMEAIGTLAGGIAHDFNNLLTGVIGYLGFAQRGLPPGTRARDDVHQAERAARRAAELTGRLLAYARRQMVSPSRLDVNASVRSVEPLLHRILGEQITIVSELADGVWPTRADAAQLEQVLVNLAINARDAMPNGGMLRFVTRNAVVDERVAAAEAEMRAGEYAAVDVEDSGTGMDAATATRIFEPFFTTKPVGQGTGLGLAMCFGIVKQAGGHILVRSQPGHGSCFTVLLPRFDEADAAAPADGAGAPTEITRGSESVLVVEDDATVRDLAVRTLRDAGYAVVAANGLSEARAAAAATARVDLVLSDIVMPGDAGPAVVEEIWRRHPRARVVYMSGYAPGTLAPAAALPPDAAFLPKPFTPAGLAHAVRAALDEQPRPVDTGTLQLEPPTRLSAR